MWGFKSPVTPEGFSFQVPEVDMTPNRSEMSFSAGIANQIKERDNFTCACGRCARDGFKIHASHKDHSKKNPYYNHPNNGEAQCIMCHLQRHMELFVQAEIRGDESINRHWARAALKLLTQEIWTSGVMIDSKADFETRQNLNLLYERYNVDIGEFINLQKVIEYEQYGGEL